MKFSEICMSKSRYLNGFPIVGIIFMCSSLNVFCSFCVQCLVAFEFIDSVGCEWFCRLNLKYCYFRIICSFCIVFNRLFIVSLSCSLLYIYCCLCSTLVLNFCSTKVLLLQSWYQHFMDVTYKPEC